MSLAFKHGCALLLALTAVTLTACRRGSIDPPQAGALPDQMVAVGPTPGPKVRLLEPTNPFANDDIAISTGKTLFGEYNCGGCHGNHGGGGMGPSLRDEVWLYGDSEAQIFASISEGRGNGMPSWGTKIPERQIWELVSYIKTLRTPREPGAPDQSLPREPIP